MGKTKFSLTVIASWTSTLLAAWVGYNYSLPLGIILDFVGIATFAFACKSRGAKVDHQKSASFAIGCYAIGPHLVLLGVLLKDRFDVHPPLPIIIAGPGIWLWGTAMMAASAIWNGGWYIQRHK